MNDEYLITKNIAIAPFIGSVFLGIKDIAIIQTK
jgi:hypothetical protein